MDNKSGQKKKIESLSDFLLWVNQNKTDTQYVETFFRGHADKSYKLQPSVYRTTKEGNSYRLHESSFYNSMLQSNPKAFENDNTTFDKLVRMQHHGLPTRLLDVTSNPLVALFFACNQSAKSDGKILLFSPQKNEILFPSEISRLALAGIESGLNVIELFYSIIDEIKKEDNNFLSIILLAWAFNEYQNESATSSNEIDESEEKKKENVNELMEEISKCIDELEEMKRSMVTIGFESRISEISKRRNSAYEKFKNKMLSIETLSYQ